MSADDRVQVYTSVPQWQKEEWADHADELDMSQAEFVRNMVQTGRKGFDPERNTKSEQSEKVSANSPGLPATNSGSTPKPRGEVSEGLEAQVRDVLGRGEHLSWDELVTALTEDIEDRLEETLQELQATDEVRYSGRHDGYTLIDDE